MNKKIDFSKWKGKILRNKSRKRPVIKIGASRNRIMILWGILIFSIILGIYNNITSVKKEIIHEKEVINKEVIDTNGIENFVKRFVTDYYTWNPGTLEQRTMAINNYLTPELQNMNVDTIRSDIPTISTVTNIQIWNIEQRKRNEFLVAYTVNQLINEADQARNVTSSYALTVYVDDNRNMVIIQNPTLYDSIPEKSSYEPERVESDSTIDTNQIAEITAFLETFFRIYPTATAEELAYYVKEDAITPINNSGYIYSRLLNPVFIQGKNNVKVNVYVEYLDQQTKATQVSQYNLTLSKSENWMIVN